MKTKIWINKANSFEDARDFDSAYYLNLTSAERIETIQFPFHPADNVDPKTASKTAEAAVVTINILPRNRDNQR